MSVFFILLAYNTDPHILKRNLHVLKEKNVIIVDNSENFSQKVSTLLTNVELKHILLLEQKKNVGYAQGMNVGMNEAWKGGADWCVLLNDDVLLTSEIVQYIMNTVPQKKPSLLGPEVGILDKKRWTTILLTNKELQKNTPAIDYISGSCLIIHKDVVKNSYGFYPDYFMYYEDVDLCIDAKRRGFPIEWLPLPHFEHNPGSSIESGSALHEYYLARNHLLFVERKAPFIIKIRELVRLPKTLYQHYTKNRGAFFGVVDFILTRFGKASSAIR